MKKLIVAYLLILLVSAVTLGLTLYCGVLKTASPFMTVSIYCSLLGLIGGITHCLRAFYLHSSLLKNWQTEWEAWYFIRPIVSGIMGFISLLFIKAGLLVFSNDASINIENRIILYLIVAFLAGYNVQNFLKKIDEISKSCLGIEEKEPPK